jgi:choline dehydrogenase-like flavoprotein
LPAAKRNGARFVEGFEVGEILWDDTYTTAATVTATGVGAERRAIGVRGTWTSRDEKGGVSSSVEERKRREVVIKAKKVIISAGTLNSPLILMKSGLKVGWTCVVLDKMRMKWSTNRAMSESTYWTEPTPSSS